MAETVIVCRENVNAAGFCYGRGPMRSSLARNVLLLLAATLTAVVTTTSAGAAPKAGRGERVRRMVLTCPAGTRPQLRDRTSFLFERAGGYAMPRRTLACTSADGRREGPALELRSGVRGSWAHLKKASYFLPSQVMWQSHYRDDRADGTWIQLARDGRVLQRVVLGAKTGERAFLQLDDEDRVRVRGALRDGRRTGRWTYLTPEGRVAAHADFRDDLLHGEVRVDHADGSPQLMQAYRDGKRDGVETQWWTNGLKRNEGEWRGDVRHGAFCFWNEYGDLLGCNELREGSGRWREWYAHGNLRSSGPMVRDRRDGTWETYWENGVLQGRGEYRGGLHVADSWQYFDAKGAPSKGSFAVRAMLGNRVRVTGGVGGGLVGRGGGVGVAGGSGGGGGGLGIGGFGRGSASVRGPTVKILPLPTSLRPDRVGLSMARRQILTCPWPMHGGKPLTGVAGAIDVEIAQDGRILRANDRSAARHPAWSACVERALTHLKTGATPGSRGQLIVLARRAHRP